MALLGSSDNQVGILIKSQADLKALDQAKNSIGGLDKASSGSSGAVGMLGKAGKLAAIGIAAAGAATAAVGVQAVKAAGDYEQSRVAFETMLGSADKARAMMSDIYEFAKTTPFELPEVVKGTKQLLAFGIEQEQLIPTMRRLGDIASGVGVPVGQLTNVFGQVKVAGRLMGQDLLQFTNAGVPLIAELAKTMKKPQTEIKDLVSQGKVGFKEVEDAIISMTGEGSKFGGMMDKQSKTFQGVVSNIKDGFGQLLRSMVGITKEGDIIEGGLFDRVKEAAEAVMPVVQKLSEEVGPKMTEIFQAISSAISKVVEVMKEIWAVVGPIIVPMFEELFRVFKEELLPVLQEFWQTHGEEIMKVLKMVGIIIGGVVLAAIVIFVAALIGLVKIVTAVIAIFTKLYSAVVFVREGIGNFIKTVVNGVSAFNSFVIGSFVKLINFFKSVPQKISDAFSGLKDRITAPFTQAWEWIKNLPSMIVNKIGDIGSLLRDKIGDWDIPGPLGKVKDVIPGFARGVRNYSGGLAVVGERGPELVNLPKGSDVYSNADSKAMMSGVTNNKSIMINNLYVGSADGGFFQSLDQDQLLVSKGLTPTRGVS